MWQRPTGTSRTQGDEAVCLVFFFSSAKEDSSPDSNLTLESDSSGVFLSLSNQSQEDAGSDSDQPVSGSELGSSNTSLEKDGDDGVLKEWGREESAELQWCYPTLLGTMSHEDMQEDGERLESECGSMGVDKERETDDRQRKSHKLGVVSISRSNIQYTGQKGFINVPQSERKVNTIGYDSPLSLSPSKQAVKHLLDPNQKPIRSSGLDYGDLDPFVQSDSFVYLAVSARPPSGEESKAVTGISSQDSEREHVQLSAESTKAHFGIANTEQDTKPTHLVAHKPEEGDFLCTDSFVYLAAPACLLLGPAGSAPYSGKYVCVSCISTFTMGAPPSVPTHPSVFVHQLGCHKDKMHLTSQQMSLCSCCVHSIAEKQQCSQNV